MNPSPLTLVIALLVTVSCLPAADPIPDFMKIVVASGPTATPAEVATQNAVQLDNSMMAIYDRAHGTFQQNFVAQTPIIMALFTNAGGNWILYRPGQPPLIAPQVPVGYQIVKGVSHSAMAIYQIVAPYVGNPADPSWLAPLTVWCAQQKGVLATAGDLDLPADVKDAVKGILNANIGFMETSLKNKTFTADELTKFARSLEPFLGKTIGYAAKTQVTHWMGVMDDWKKLLGDDWSKTYGLTNTLYVTRTNTIFFTIMAQYFGREAINDRLLLFETTEFQTEAATMLDLLSRIVADRVLGRVFFRDFFLMDVELVSSGSREAITNDMAKRIASSGGAYATYNSRNTIVDETKKRGMALLMPPLAPFHSQQWPWRTIAADGEGAATIKEAYEEKGGNKRPNQ